MKLEVLPVSSLKPYENNAKLHPPEQIAQIRKSIEELGFNDPIAVDENNVVIEGHGRLLALQDMGWETVECIRLDGMTDDQKRAYIHIHNQLTMNTGFDLDILEQELRSIEGIDLGFFGFDLDFAVEPELDFDDGEKAQAELTAAAAQQPPRAKLGQLWALGEHRLLVGDCTSAEAVNRLTGGQQMDLCVTDPPYNVDYVGKTADALTIENDSMNLGQFYEFLRDFYKQMLRALKPGGSFYVFYSPGANGLTFREALHAVGGRDRQILAWVKNSMVLGHSDYHYKHEPCLYGWKEGAGHYFTKDRTQTTVFENRPDPENMTHAELVQLAHFLLDKLEALPNTIIRENKPARNALHPTMKPIPLLARLIQNSSRRGEKVIDFFGGSGSTLMACQETGRVCYTMELDPKYADVIIARWEESTGGKAVLMYGDQ